MSWLACLIHDGCRFALILFLSFRFWKKNTPFFFDMLWQVFDHEISYIEGGTASGFYTVEDIHYITR